MMFGESPFATAPFGSYAGEERNASVTIGGTSAKFNQSAFTVFGHSSVTMDGAGATYNAGEFAVYVFLSVGIPIAGAKFNADTVSVVPVLT